MIDGAAVKAEADVKIDLLGLRETPGAAAVEKLTGSLMVVISHILHNKSADGPNSRSSESVGSKVGFALLRLETR